MIRTIMMTTAGLAAWCGTALAQSFDGGDVDGFIAVMKASEALSEKYEDADIPMPADVGDDVQGFGTMLDEGSEFRIFSLMSEAMMRAPDHPAITEYHAMVKEAGFADLAGFGEKADAIMMAYLALETDGESLDLDGLTPEMMAMMPPAAREQMAPILRMVEAIENVPAEDIDALRPYAARLRAAMDE